MVVLKQLTQSAAKGSRAWFGATVMVLACISASAQAQDLLVRNATVHTASARGSLQNADVLVQGGIIRAVGNGLSAPAGATVIEANGRPLTPARGLSPGAPAPSKRSRVNRARWTVR